MRARTNGATIELMQIILVLGMNAKQVNFEIETETNSVRD
jgi:hypothetical protein